VLAREAQEAGYVDGGDDDQLPGHGDHDLLNKVPAPEKNEG